MVAVAVVAGAATIVGLVVLWPHGKVARPRSITTQKTIGAKVTSVARTPCTIGGASGCKTIYAEITQGGTRAGGRSS